LTVRTINDDDDDDDYYYFKCPGSIGPGVKKRKRLKANMEWLEVRIVMPGE